MSKFSLIQQLEQPKAPVAESSGIQYQQYELEVEGTDRVINIPLREAENFETAVGELTTDIDGPTLKKLLRQFRGIRG